MATTIQDNVITLAALNDNYANNCVIEGIVYTGTTAGHECVIKAGSDGSGNILYDVKISANNESIMIDLKAYAKSGFKVTTLSSGAVQVYLRID